MKFDRAPATRWMQCLVAMLRLGILRGREEYPAETGIDGGTARQGWGRF